MRVPIAAVSLALAACASAGGETPAPAAPSATVTPPAEGQLLYARHCLTCHQSDGYGVPNLQPAIAGGSWVQGDPAALALFVMTGGFNSADRKDGDSHNVMPAFRQLTDGELAALLSYIRARFGKGASAVTAADIATVRAALP